MKRVHTRSRYADAEVRKIVILQSRYGAYHVARLKACATTLETRSVVVIGVQVASTDEYAWESVDEKNDYRLYTIHPGKDYRMLSSTAIRRSVLQTLNEINPDAVVINGYSFADARAAILWCRQNGKSAVVTSDSKKDDGKRIFYKEFVKRTILRLCDSALVAGTASRDYLTELGFHQEMIWFGADTVDNTYYSRHAEIHRALQTTDVSGSPCGDGKCFLMVGRFIKEKNLSNLLLAYKKYRKNVVGQPWSLSLVGDGPEGEVLQSITRSEKLEGVIFSGFQKSERLPFFYAHANALILPSIKDTWGLVVNEAMACSLPVLVSRGAGASYDLVEENGNGWTFDPLNIDDIAGALMRMHQLSDDERRRFGQRSKQIIERWGLDLYAEGVWQAACAGMKNALQRNHRLNPLKLLMLKV